MIRFVLTGLSAACLSAAPQLRDFSHLHQALAERVGPAIVQIVTTGYAPASEGVPVLSAKRSMGAGVIVDPSGFIITNAHLVGDVGRVRVLLPITTEDARRRASPPRHGGKLVAAQVLGLDRETDLAVLKVAGNEIPFLPFADSDGLRQGQLVFAFGSPYGLQNSVSMGIVSSVARQARPDDTFGYIQTDASINVGNSGGPLVDADGRIAGINTFIVSRTGANDGVGFAVPNNVVRTTYEHIRVFGRVRRGHIGLLPQTITPGFAEALSLPTDWGVIVADLNPAGSAKATGIRINDIILRANGKRMEDTLQFGACIYPSAGKVITLQILRGNSTLNVDVAILEKPKDPARILSLVRGEENAVPALGILAGDLDERVTPLLPSRRKLVGSRSPVSSRRLAASPTTCTPAMSFTPLMPSRYALWRN